jgi:ubiquinone biosynthesis protein COQ9
LLLPWREAVARHGGAGIAAECGTRLAPARHETVDGLVRGRRYRPISASTRSYDLGAIYAAAMLFWLETSPGCIETDAFVERRLADLHRLTELRQRFEAAAERLPNPLRLLRPIR